MTDLILDDLTIQCNNITIVRKQDAVILTNMEGLDPGFWNSFREVKIMALSPKVGVIVIRDFDKNSKIGISKGENNARE